MQLVSRLGNYKGSPLMWPSDRRCGSQAEPGPGLHCVWLSRVVGCPESPEHLLSSTALSNCLFLECSCAFPLLGPSLCLVWLDMPLPSTPPVPSPRLISNVFCTELFFLVMVLHQTPVAFRLFFAVKCGYLCTEPISTPLNPWLYNMDRSFYSKLNHFQTQ